MNAATQKPAAVSARPPSRMTLGSITKGKQQHPLKIVLYGVEGIGKSTFAAGAPEPIFLGAEEGTSQLDVQRFPAPERWSEVIEALRTLTNESHPYKTLVIDTLDWAEPLLWDFCCKRDGEASIESYGYGKGYNAAFDEWRVFLRAVEELRKAKGMHVLLLAHSWVKTFKNPEGPDFDHYEMKLHAKAGGLIREWADAVLFANYETLTVKDDKTKRVRGVDTGARLIYTERRAAFEAKNRYSLPPSMPLSWADFAAGVEKAQPADPAVLLSEVQRKLKELGGELEKQGTAAIGRANGDASRLAWLNNWCNAKLAERES